MKTLHFSFTKTFLVLCLCKNSESFTCNDGYTCFEEENTDVVWVMASGSGSPCSSVCENGLYSTAGYKCKGDQPSHKTIEEFEHVSQGLGINCNSGGCWSGSAGDMAWVSRDLNTNRNCYLPKTSEVYSCSKSSSNANCFGERYDMVCPCEQKAQVPTEAPTNPICEVKADPFLPCKEPFSCWKDNDKDIVWVMGDEIFSDCRGTCQQALDEHSDFYVCKSDEPIDATAVELEPISTGLGFSCKAGGCSFQPDGAVWIDRTQNCDRSCKFPLNTEGNYDCHASVGNANCFGERYTQVCPCNVKALDEACEFSCPDHSAPISKWPKDDDGTSCLESINYWRWKACFDGWPECPPAGLPPIVECTSCHQCANSQSEYDNVHGSHKSFTRCGEFVQGSGGGRTCRDVINAFVSERGEFGGLCKGHCGPIVAPGCTEFHWGRTLNPNNAGFYHYTLNWGNCNTNKCDAHCDSAEAGTINECFPSGIDTPGCSDTPSTNEPTGSPVEPTGSPVEPTGSPVEPTGSPVSKNTDAPTVSAPVMMKVKNVKSEAKSNKNNYSPKLDMFILGLDKIRLTGVDIVLMYNSTKPNGNKIEGELPMITKGKRGKAAFKFPRIKNEKTMDVRVISIEKEGYEYDENTNKKLNGCRVFSSDCPTYTIGPVDNV